MSIVMTYHGSTSIEDDAYWHVVGRGGPYAWMFYNNVRVSKGYLVSVSAAVASNPAWDAMQSPYSAARRDDPKETVFERVRAQSYPELPGRLKALFVFDDSAYVTRAQATWFKDDPRDALECRLFSNAIRHRADSAWLNAPPEDWERNAHQYWQGAMTVQPLPEIVVCGGIYFPGWESFPDATL